jgi:type I restriction enzyme R subunit
LSEIRSAKTSRMGYTTSLFDQYGADAKAILEILLDGYAQGGSQQLIMPASLKVKAVEKYGNVREIVAKFGGRDKLKEAVEQLQTLLYTA